MDERSPTPRLRRGVRFRFDAVRGVWVLLAPEKLFLPDETAVEILKLVDGERTIATIVDHLARIFDAPRDVIEPDVRAMIDDLVAKGVVCL